MGKIMAGKGKLKQNYTKIILFTLIRKKNHLQI